MMRKRVAFLVAFLMVMMLIPCTVFGDEPTDTKLGVERLNATTLRLHFKQPEQ